MTRAKVRRARLDRKGEEFAACSWMGIEWFQFGPSI